MEKITLGEGLMAQMMESEAWQRISGNHPFSEAQLEKFADKLNWKNVINNWNNENLDVKAVLDKFGDRIPVTEFKDSPLWRELVEQKKTEVKRILCLG